MIDMKVAGVEKEDAEEILGEGEIEGDGDGVQGGDDERDDVAIEEREEFEITNIDVADSIQLSDGYLEYTFNVLKGNCDVVEVRMVKRGESKLYGVGGIDISDETKENYEGEIVFGMSVDRGQYSLNFRCSSPQEGEFKGYSKDGINILDGKEDMLISEAIERGIFKEEILQKDITLIQLAADYSISVLELARINNLDMAVNTIEKGTTMILPTEYYYQDKEDYNFVVPVG